MSWLITGPKDENDIMTISRICDMEHPRNAGIPIGDGVLMPGPPEPAKKGFIRTTTVNVKEKKYIYVDIPEPIPPDPDVPTYPELVEVIEKLTGGGIRVGNNEASGSIQEEN